jgi:hypothetical protein
MRTLAKEFGLSDVGLAKICEKHHIPRPPVGHWVRVERGHHPEQTPLPDIEDAKLDVVNITIREKSLDILGQNLDPQVQAILVPAVIAVQSEHVISHPFTLTWLCGMNGTPVHDPRWRITRFPSHSFPSDSINVFTPTGQGPKQCNLFFRGRRAVGFS